MDLKTCSAVCDRSSIINDCAKHNDTRLKTHATETDIARLFIALVEYRFMRKCPIKTFRNACTTSLINKKSFMKEIFRKHTKISFRHLETAKS